MRPVTLQPSETTSTPTEAPALSLCGVALAYRGIEVLSGIDLEVTKGEIIAVIGPSGSGKSSLLRCLGGFLDPTTGSVHIGGRLVADGRRSVPPEQRQVGYVFQNHALWPHMTVRENVAYPWRIRQIGVEERGHLADALLNQVGLDGLGDRMPATLSGGQQQRVALARGLAGDPHVLLLDEPLSSVDASRRDELQSLIAEVVRARSLTTILTTHDQREAMTLADRIVVLGGGTIAQCSSPVDLHEHPNNGFVAHFMGALNVIEVQVKSRESGRLVLETIEYHDALVVRTSEQSERQVGVLVARPEAIRLTDPGQGDQDGDVLRCVLSDGRTEVRVQVGGIVLRVFEEGVPRRVPGERVGVIIERCLIIAKDA